MNIKARMDNNINVRRKIVPCCQIMIIIPNLKIIKPCEIIFLNQENKINVEKEDSHSSKVEKCGGSFKTTKSLRGT